MALQGGGSARLLLDGALLRFGRHGQGTSNMPASATVPAKLLLEMTCMDSGRQPSDVEQRALATMEGQLTFRNGETPVFSASLDEEGQVQGLVIGPQAVDEAPDGATSRRVLRFAFGAPDFEQVPTRQELVVKLDPKRFRFLEVRTRLEVAGIVESDFEVNDVLDVAITPKNPPPLVAGATVGIHPPLFDEIPPNATLVITPSTGPALTFALDSGVDRGDGLLSFTVEEPQPGVLYRAEMRVAGASQGTVLFKDVELHQLVAESEGASPAPLSSFLKDALAFESAPAEPARGEAVQGGPEETTDQQLASLDAQAGTVALA